MCSGNSRSYHSTPFGAPGQPAKSCSPPSTALRATWASRRLPRGGARLVRLARWPDSRFATVLIAVVAFGVVYTAYSEHLNTAVRRAWTYSALMPVLPGLGVGL